MSRTTLLLALACILSASTAFAATRFNVTTDHLPNDRGVIQLLPGESLTIDIRLSDGTFVLGLGASAFGYDESVIDFASGQAVPVINYSILIPLACVCGGLFNWAVPPPDPGLPFGGRPLTLAESEILSHGNRVSFMSGVSLVYTASNSLDPGLDGTPQDAQFRLVFTARGLGESFIRIGTQYPGDGEVGPGGSLDTSADVPVRIEVIPEPVAGVLMALGLAALSAIARR